MRRILVVVTLGVALLAVAPRAHAQSREPAPLDRTGVPPTTIADTLPPPPGVPNLAWLAAIEFEPALADSQRRAFMSAFRGAFAEGAYATERTRDGRAVASVPIPARFRLLEGGGGSGLWSVQVVVRVPQAPKAGVPGALEVSIAALAPAAVAAGARPLPQVTRLAPAPADGDGAGAAEAAGGVAWWRRAGRASGLLALDRLHHLSGDLDEDTALALGPLRRVTP